MPQTYVVWELDNFSGSLSCYNKVQPFVHFVSVNVGDVDSYVDDLGEDGNDIDKVCHHLKLQF